MASTQDLCDVLETHMSSVNKDNREICFSSGAPVHCFFRCTMDEVVGLCSGTILYEKMHLSTADSHPAWGGTPADLQLTASQGADSEISFYRMFIEKCPVRTCGREGWEREWEEGEVGPQCWQLYP